MQEVKKYKVESSKQTFSAVTAHINTLNYQGYSNDFTFAGNEKIVTSTLFDYKKLLLELSSIEDVEFITHYDFCKNQSLNYKNKLLIAIRHDIDSDIIAAAQQAKIENELGIKSSWYVLHTAPYYGYFDNDIFYRHNCMAYYYKYIQDLGHEVGLHTDGLLVYQDYKVDGACAVKEEINWLRNNGIDVKGTLAHNSESVYGAFNYEIFQNRNRKNEAIKNNKCAPLGVLSENEIGLEYEGNEVLWQERMPMEYGATRNLNEWRWVKHQKESKTRQIKCNFTNQERVISDIKKLPLGTLVVLVVHPLYYGARDSQIKSPKKPFNRTNIQHNESLGWFTYKPQSFQSLTNYKDYHTLNMTNEYGMIDYLLFDKDYSDYKKILFLGSTNTNAQHIGIKRCFTALLQELLNTNDKQNKYKVQKLAFDGMGIDRLYSWFEKCYDRLTPEMVCIGLSKNIFEENLPHIWTQVNGCSVNYFAGDVLIGDRNNNFELKEASPQWELHQKNIGNFSGSIDTKENYDYVLALYKYVIDRLLERNIDIFLYQEDYLDDNPKNKVVFRLFDEISQYLNKKNLALDFDKESLYDGFRLNLEDHERLAYMLCEKLLNV
ncbi:hypothetical protein Q6A86_01995 [Aliarcobacter skirrowii]|uniref:hypothetical protein n=1 Tax=Aliarcobacter skirrowii TaxID=28200 RepID=UPI0029AC1D26|nr:hypothetical protein [Aliarcobacter skirrowii]MDX4011749.1 hypothetical protein [Aliarcobacter skirrowii]